MIAHLALVAFWSLIGQGEPSPRFERIVIDSNFPGAYQVEIADVNGDDKPDIIALGGDACVWYENPSWAKHSLAGLARTPGVITSATYAKADGGSVAAIGYEFEQNRPDRGKLLIARREKGEVEPRIEELGGFPSIHRLRWGNTDGEGAPELILAPIFGPSATPPAYQQEKAQVLVLHDPGPGGIWTREVAGADYVIHGIRVLDFDFDNRDEILVAGNSGITLLDRDNSKWSARSITPGAKGDAPFRGSSEIQVGRTRLRGSPEQFLRFLATIDPWHGERVVIHRPPMFAGSAIIGEGWSSDTIATMVDDTLDAGHALWVADFDGDGDDEVFAGHRGKDHRVSLYDFDGKNWIRTVLDRDIAAQDLRGGDLDGDGSHDVVSVGGSTHNVVWYRPRRDRTD
jgi:hypothetical protein